MGDVESQGPSSRGHYQGAHTRSHAAATAGPGKTTLTEALVPARQHIDPVADLERAMVHAAADVANLENANRTGDLSRAFGLRSLVTWFIDHAATLVANVGRARAAEFIPPVRALLHRAQAALDAAPHVSQAAREAAQRRDYSLWDAELAPWRAKASSANPESFHDSALRVERGGMPQSTAQTQRPQGDGQMWSVLAPGETSVSIHLISRVDAFDGVYLRSQPAGGKDGSLLPFGTLVTASRKTEKGWYYVTVVPEPAVDSGGASSVPVGSSGFIEGYHVASEMPEPMARLHKVAAGAHLKDIAAQYYKHGFAWGNDARLYVQAIYHANKDRAAVFRQKADLTVNQDALATTSLDRALELWGQARVVSGQALWMPSQEFVHQLQAGGAIHHASISTSVWNQTVAMAADAWDLVQYTGGFALGLVQGGLHSLFELFKGIPQLVTTVWAVVKDLFNNFTELRGLAKKISEAWKHRDAILQRFAAEFTDKWEQVGDYARGLFQGEFLGNVMMTAFIILVTLGEGAIIMGAGRFGSFIQLVRFADEFGSLGTYVRKFKAAIRLPNQLIDDARKALGHTPHPHLGGDRPRGHVPEGTPLHAGAPHAGEAPHVGTPEVDSPPANHASISRVSDARAHASEELAVATAHAEAPTAVHDRTAGHAVKLSRRQQAIADKLPKSGSISTFSKREVSMADLRELTRATGDEYSMYTLGSKRLVIRGYGNKIRVPDQLAEELLAGRHGKWSGHTHPPGYSKKPGPADRPNIPSIQERSAVWGDDGIERFHRTPHEDYLFEEAERRTQFRRMYRE